MTCPVCQSNNTDLLINMGNQPPSLVMLTRDKGISLSSNRLPMRMFICRNCNHVFNADFNPACISYSQDGCRMWNNGTDWKEHINFVRDKVSAFPSPDLIIEIGAGDCEFLDSVDFDGPKLAIDPCSAVTSAEELGISYIRSVFKAEQIPDGCKSVVVVMRHLLEHMCHPRNFIESIVRRADKIGCRVFSMIEVPCCANALSRGRIEDWTYEHPQHFTLQSVVTLMRMCGIYKTEAVTSYGGEVIVCLAEYRPHAGDKRKIDEAIARYQSIDTEIENTRRFFIDNIHRTAFWGGAGKSAVFINRFKLPDLAVVVDSDERKWSYYVPGTNIKILSPSTLHRFPIDYIVATTSWRANDIAKEIKALGVKCKKLFKFEGGTLVEVPLGD